MAFPINNDDVIHLQVGCYWAGQVGLNNFHARVSLVVGTPSLEDVAEYFDNLWAPLYKPLMTNTAAYYGVRAQIVRPLPKSVAVISAANVGPGTGGTDGLPGQVCGIISYNGFFSGRRYLGRIYVPFPDESANDNNTNTPDPGYTSSLQTLADDTWGIYNIVDGGNSYTITFGIFHRNDGSISEIAGATPRQKWGTQRSRSSYGSKNDYPPF